MRRKDMNLKIMLFGAAWMIFWAGVVIALLIRI